jgi:endo-alpha-1,4-polygalactosaminidase (GH114 family)
MLRAPAATSFQVQLGGNQINTGVDASLFDLDWQTARAVLSHLHARARKAFCYISVGSWENFRPDARRFPRAVLGKKYGGYPNERWLDVRRLDVLEPIMGRRMKRCKRSGFDGVWFDNVDGFTMHTGFPITSDDQLTYNATLANDAHSLGLAAAFNNDPKQLPDMVPYFDWVLFELDRHDVEACFFRTSCNRLQAFHDAGKATFILEYEAKRKQRFCRTARERGFNGILKRESLSAYRVPCRLLPD